MEIPVNKNSLASVLTALGKLVSRTSLIKAYQGIEIEGKTNLLSFRTRNMTEEIEFLLFADLEDDFPATIVEFEQFRLAVRNSKNKTLKLEIDCGDVFIDGIKLAPIQGNFPSKEEIPDQDIAINLSNVLFHGEICLFFAQWEISNKLLEFSPQGGIEAIKGPHISKIVF